MDTSALEPCPNCRALLPPHDGPTHRYIGASAPCWAIYSALNVGEPAVAPTHSAPLMVDAYAAQHYGEPSPQAIQSVAVHLIALYGVLEAGHSVEQVLWLRTRPLRDGKRPKHSRFHWLTPPDFSGKLTVAAIVQASTPTQRAEVMDQYVHQVWSVWGAIHAQTVQAWYTQYVLADQI